MGAEAKARARVEGDGGYNRLVAVINELRGAYLSGGRHESDTGREVRMNALVVTRADQLTLSLVLMLPDGDPIVYLLNNAFLGMRFSKDLGRPDFTEAPLFPSIALQSLRVKCAQCSENRCGRKGKAHDVVYKTAPKSGTHVEHRLMTSMGGTTDHNVLCRADPETGLFALAPLEAKKALRQWGESVIRPRRRYTQTGGDRWLIRDVRHYALYGAGAFTDVTNDVQPMVP